MKRLCKNGHVYEGTVYFIKGKIYDIKEYPQPFPPAEGCHSWGTICEGGLNVLLTDKEFKFHFETIQEKRKREIDNLL